MKQNPHPSSKAKKQKVNQKNLVLFNDDFNSFDHVIDCLVAICEHDPIQAEQCALITHFNGRCVIKNGKTKDLLFLKSDLQHYNLDAEVI
ncbi:MAG: ATP-dependent Clp protease adaptor ClpS [Bacteroidota bacterium]|nr:ATP-dependent Clp protease adaptor ClpS [Bacteroidota bacterium]